MSGIGGKQFAPGLNMQRVVNLPILRAAPAPVRLTPFAAVAQAPSARRIIDARATPVERLSRGRAALQGYARAQLGAGLGRRLDIVA
jgi:hypothetical protein